VTSLFRILFLDLDDTLYPSSAGLWEAIGDRILSFMVDVVGVPEDRAPTLRDEYFRAYGTTLTGLRIHQAIDPLEYLHYVHDVPLDRYLDPDPAARAILAATPLRRVVFTNSDRHHADRVLARLGLADVIDQIVDIIDLDWVPKPDEAAYTKAMALVGEPDPRACLLLDDLVRNLLPAERLGMTGVLVGRKDLSADTRIRIDSVRELPTVFQTLGVPFHQAAG
jgi:putative hydrolase of the HAD superfamily